MAATPRHCGRKRELFRRGGTRRHLAVTSRPGGMSHREKGLEAWRGARWCAAVSRPVVAASLPLGEAVVSRSSPHAPRLLTLTDEYAIGASRLHTGEGTAASAFPLSRRDPTNPVTSSPFTKPGNQLRHPPDVR